MQKITPFLWFNNNAEEAVSFYTSIFKNSKIKTMARYDEASAQASGMPAGTVMTASFELNGQDFVAINGGPHFKFTEAISFVVSCEDQDEIDHYWNKLSEGGDPKAQQCGWLKDKFGLSWQVVPAELSSLLKKSKHVMMALMQMKKLDLNKLREVADGKL
jgi:predicted 3-demethylubiquinone-9 3-methyltransferase (glyoxalase superfamily)